MMKSKIISNFNNTAEINIVYSSDNDKHLAQSGIAILKDRYLSKSDESPQDLFARISAYYANNNEHAARLYKYMSSLWFMPATPVLSNGGTERGCQYHVS